MSIAPMMDRTDRHFRWLVRLLSKRVLLYTEMVTAQAVARGDVERLLGFAAVEHPVALQLGGDDAALLVQAARIGVDLGYDEVNLNCGCPSPRVTSGGFGASLMLEPERVADAVAAMRAAVSVPVTVKHRLGVDDVDRYEDVLAFVDVVAEAGCDRFIVHARKALLQGLSPKENREVPPLRWDEVARLKRDRPALQVEINGGIRSWEVTEELLQTCDGVMIGRWAWDDPMQLAEIDSRFFGVAASGGDFATVAAAYHDYARGRLALGDRASFVYRPLLELHNGRPGARRWRGQVAQAMRDGTAEFEATIAHEQTTG